MLKAEFYFLSVYLKAFLEGVGIVNVFHNCVFCIAMTNMHFQLLLWSDEEHRQLIIFS